MHCGARTIDEQRRLVAEGRSKTMRSKHLCRPSRAVDIAPYSLAKNEDERIDQFYALAVVVGNSAKELGIIVRWGGDWDGDGDYADQTFNDLYHWELV